MKFGGIQMKNVLARIRDFFDYVFNHNVIKDQTIEDEKFIDLKKSMMN